MGHALMTATAKILVPLFFLGMGGSVLVVIATLIRDLGQVMSGEAKDPNDV